MVKNVNTVFGSKGNMPHFSALEEDIDTDVLVIGGGIAGILTARLLTDAGVDTVLLEAERLCTGQTAGTTAKITQGHGFCYANTLKRYGKEGTRLRFEAGVVALEKYRRMARSIACDLEVQDLYLYAKQDRDALAEELEALSQIGADVRRVKPQELPFRTVGAIRFREQALFDPQLFLAGAVNGVKVFENTPVTALFEGGARTASGRIVRARHMVVATHFPFLRFRGGYALKMYQSRSYVLALSGVRLPRAMYADGLSEGVALRRCGDLLLLSGAGHRTGTAGGGYRELEQLAAAYYPGARVEARFAAQDCITPDGMPYIGRYTKRDEGLYVITGFGKWGMTNAMTAASVITDAILARENPYAEIFSPSRPIPWGAFLRGMAITLSHYVRPTVPRCPHLGCALRYNAQERSWDCPCHGSRFDRAGRLIDDPAQKDLKKSPRMRGK
ncbi:MAG: FAD-dependent oxidoreductase [Ruminococcaceae bacterium]|nr:FAD-dependent oxidoreductase [Oscillospiraceae bacterium]